MAKETYDIQELVTQSGVPRRTIYFYVQQGVLPPPEGAGLAAHYNEDHLLRLRLIPTLRQQGLRLDEIRARFLQMSGEEMRAMLAASRPALLPPRAIREPAAGQPGAQVPGPGLPGAPIPAPLPFAPEYPAMPPGWAQQRFTHYPLPAGITVVAPENLGAADRQRLSQLLQAARQIFSGSQVVYIAASQGPAPKDSSDTNEPGDNAGGKTPPEEG